MFKKYTLFLGGFLLLSISLSSHIKSKTPDTHLQSYVSPEVFSTFENFCKTLEAKIKELSNNDKGCLINLLDSQFYFFDLMEKELKNGNPNQEKLGSMMQSFQNVLEAFEKQCDQKIKELNEEIQKQTAMLIPQELAAEIQTLQENMQKMYTKAKEKNQLDNKEFEKKMMTLQTDLMQKLLHIQTITSIASLEIYEIIYTSIEQKNKNLLVRRFNIKGIIPLTKRKENVTHPNRARELIESFLSQAGAMSEDNTGN
jgi:hypothetical protein